ncbi:DUF4118 domain-containing protein [Planococcus kocurii]|uniref:histidine kinase n=1 Tax=Planococcus kocurii TaxID=1374 RepID=A0ABM5WT56_9BACL|nr:MULTISPECIES: sensor histidine kinase KdpD [Planococcus]ALS77437.1 histidine kinase [Planococcus kocurii]KAA0959184.1 sensor histidine kinase KdpD [Planococcus sp. ANT_H30]
MEDNRPNPEKILAKIKQQQMDLEKGKLKIFLGYAAGVGKTYAMLDAAHHAKALGIDVIIGYIEPHIRPETTALLNGLESIPPIKIDYKEKTFKELDIDTILKRKPSIVVIDELAHSNVPTMRHLKRFGDVNELLAQGIDVYTTVNIQHIESLHDLVEEITGVNVRERIPDFMIDNASQIKLVDIEPDDLIQRLIEGKIYKSEQVKYAMDHFFQRKNLVALREIALRRTADTVYRRTAHEAGSFGTSGHIEEHILVGISSSSTNPKVIRSAARLAQALHGNFTAIYVQKDDNDRSYPSDSQRIQEHSKLVEQLGGRVVSMQADDVAATIANYARMSGVTNLVIGKSVTKNRWWSTNFKIADQISKYAPNLAMFIVVDEHQEPKGFLPVKPQFSLDWNDLLKMIVIFIAVSAIGLLFFTFGVGESNIITIYILGVLVLALWSSGWMVSIVSSLIAVLLFNFLFTEPRFSFEAYHRDYAMTFPIMFISGFITSSLTRKVKKQAREAIRKSYRTEVLLETSRKLNYAKSLEEIITEGMSQVVKLIERPVIFCEIANELITHSVASSSDVLTAQENKELLSKFHNANERGVITWVANNNQQAGMTTDTFPEASAYYVPFFSGESVKGVLGILLPIEVPLPAFERHILNAILNDFAFALDKWYLQKATEEVKREAELEQMRANLLRGISHDLRTPLTSISGNADILLTSSNKITDEQKNQLYHDIYSNSKWLVQLVENLLAVSRLDEGKLAIEMQPEIMQDIMQEALLHVVHNKTTHRISCQVEPALAIAMMDARLLIQVLINLIDNALKYTPVGTEISLKAEEIDDDIQITVSDTGQGIDDTLKSILFEPFTTGKIHRSDSGRGLGLGLALCQSILHVHGSQLTVLDNHPTGTIFSFMLKKGDINDDE